MTSPIEGKLPQYLCSGDPNLKEYYPGWLKDIADDATVEGSMLDGVIEGPDGVRAVVLKINRYMTDRSSYPSDLTATTDGSKTTLRNSEASRWAALSWSSSTTWDRPSIRGKLSASHVGGSLRRLLAAEFAGSPIADHFRSPGSRR